MFRAFFQRAIRSVVKQQAPFWKHFSKGFWDLDIIYINILICQKTSPKWPNMTSFFNFHDFFSSICWGLKTVTWMFPKIVGFPSKSSTFNSAIFGNTHMEWFQHPSIPPTARGTAPQRGDDHRHLPRLRGADVGENGGGLGVGVPSLGVVGPAAGCWWPLNFWWKKWKKMGPKIHQKFRWIFAVVFQVFHVLFWGQMF